MISLDRRKLYSLIEELMNLPISFFDEIFYCSIVGDANYSIVAAVNFIDYAFVSLEQG